MSSRELLWRKLNNLNKMVIEREEWSLTDNLCASVTRERYQHHSFYYVNLELPDEHNRLTTPDFLSKYLDDKGLEILMALSFGNGKARVGVAEAAGQSVAASAGEAAGQSVAASAGGPAGQSLLKPLTTLWHDIPQTQVIQLICTDSKDVVLRQNSDGSCVKSLNHYGTELYFVNNLMGDSNCDNYSQAGTLFNSLKEVLRNNQIGNRGTARTWLYANNILDWYDDLNRARTTFFTEENIFDGVIPASTGIGLSNAYGSSLVMNALLVNPKEENNAVRMVSSPLQCSATDYKSSFSRAVEISLETSKRLVLSGTASIELSGKTIHHDNIGSQISHTMDVVKAIMEKEGYSLETIVRGIAYFRDPDDAVHLTDFFRSNQIESSVFLITGGTICREDLLFEIELDAVKAVSSTI